MRVAQVELRGFRTYERAVLEPASGITVLVGPNGVGKTNLLEAVGMAIVGSSPRTSSEATCIRHGAAFCRLSTRLEAGATTHTTALTLEVGGRKRVLLDDAPVESLGELSLRFPVVVFLPEKVLVVRGAPARRRATLDRLAARLVPGATNAAREYVRALTQRNTLLRQSRHGSLDPAVLAPWSALVAEHGSQVRMHRTEALEALLPRFRERFEQLTRFPDASIVVEPRGAELATALHDSLGHDRRRGSTTVGPHLDDVRFLQGDRDLRTYGSTGEQRAALLAWALAEADALAQTRGTTPLLLLDEPYAELDEHRRELLTSVLAGIGQVILTTTEAPAELQASGAIDVWQVGSGTITAVGE